MESRRYGFQTVYLHSYKWGTVSKQKHTPDGGVPLELKLRKTKVVLDRMHSHCFCFSFICVKVTKDPISRPTGTETVSIYIVCSCHRNLEVASHAAQPFHLSTPNCHNLTNSFGINWPKSKQSFHCLHFTSWRLFGGGK